MNEYIFSNVQCMWIIVILRCRQYFWVFVLFLLCLNDHLIWKLFILFMYKIHQRSICMSPIPFSGICYLTFLNGTINHHKTGLICYTYLLSASNVSIPLYNDWCVDQWVVIGHWPFVYSNAANRWHQQKYVHYRTSIILKDNVNKIYLTCIWLTIIKMPRTIRYQFYLFSFKIDM